MNLDIYNQLLSEVSELYNKIPVREKTFMDVSGYPHYENVCSNILAFYFNTIEEHNLNNLVINSLIKVLKNNNINIEPIKENDIVKISREYTTLKGNRIDIVLENDSFVIGIENKLDAIVYNDLADYANTINSINKKSIKILLSLHNNSKICENTEFINITYSELCNQLNIDLLNYQENDNKWYIFLKEFIKNLENYEGESEMEEEILNWLKENKKELDQLDEIKKIATKSIEKKVEELKNLLQEKLTVNFIKIWRGNTEMACYIDSPKKYHVNATLNPEGWKIGFFTWSVANNNKIKQIIQNSNYYNIVDDDGHHKWLFKYNYDIHIEEVLNKVIEIYEYMDNKFY